MSDYKVSADNLTSVADAIRTKGGTSASLSFPDGFVDAIDAISTGGGSTLITKSITANGTYNASNDNADGYSSVTVAVPSRVIVGTFTGSDAEKGTAKEITVPYTGSGYPIAALVYPSAGGYKTDSTLYTTLQKSALVMWSMSKSDISLAPNYSNSGANDYGTTLAIYKNSDTNALSTTSNRVETEGVYRNNTATAAHSTAFRIRSATNISVFIASTSYGFMAGVEYTYVIRYSA